MKKVTFKVAKAIKKAGYPQGLTDKVYVLEDKSVFTYSRKLAEGTLAHGDVRDYCKCVDVPTCLEVWLWLWRENNIRIRVEVTKISICDNNGIVLLENTYNDPEEAIIAAIDYLVENNLIK